MKLKLEETFENNTKPKMQVEASVEAEAKGNFDK